MTYYPNDGSLVVRDLRIWDQGTSQTEKFMGGIKELFIGDQAPLVDIMLQVQTRAWRHFEDPSDNESVPEWGPLELIPVSDGDIVFLAATAVYVPYLEIFPGGPRVTRSFAIKRWRVAFRMPSAGSVPPWHFAHVRYKIGFKDGQGNSGGETVDWEETNYGGLESHWWKGEDLAGYIHDDPETWPGTDWQVDDLPGGHEPDSDHSVGARQKVFRWLWPYHDMINKDYQTFRAAGRLPGLNVPAYRFLRPRRLVL